MITGKINVNLISQGKLFQGKKGKYLNIVLIETPASKYGDYMIKQQGEKGEEMPILGNAKIFTPKPKEETQNKKEDWKPEIDDLPF